MKDQGVWLAAVVALLAALASNGKAAFEALAGLPRVLQAFAEGLPFGLASFALALALGVLAWWHADRRLHGYGRKDPGRDFRADTLALSWRSPRTMLQTVAWWIRPGRAPAGVRLGILAGLLAPLWARMVLAILRKVGL